METVYLLLAFYFGACIGSFLNVVIWRLPQELPLTGRSFCPHCKHQLFWYDLLPIISIIWRRFSCGYCSSPISVRYPIIEIITGLLFALAYWFVGPENLLGLYQLLGMWFVLAIAIVVFVIDYEHYLILDVVIKPATRVMFAYLLLQDLFLKQLQFNLNSTLISGILGAVIISGFFYLVFVISKGRWIGFGDVKFAIFMGLTLGWSNSLVALFAAFMLGSLVGVALMIFKGKDMKSQLPFGTFLTIGMVLALFVGSDIAGWYLQLIGLR